MKYLQITIVLGLFFSFVIFRNLVRGDEESRQIGAIRPISQQPQIPTNTPSPTQAIVPTKITTTSVPSSTSAPKPTQTPLPSPTPAGKFKNGNYTGTVEDAFYGNIQVQAIVSDGKLTDVVFLDHPQDNRTSNFINGQAMPMLKAEAISAQSANVDIISGASDSSMAFQKSLASALNQAQ